MNANPIAASIQVGKVVTEGDPSTRDALTRQWTSAFRKTPIDGSVELGELGIIGDEVADHRFHGGPDKAMLCYAQSHYSRWQSEHPNLNFGPGGFGENLTIQGQDESGVCVGDRYEIGTAQIELSQPRQPCWKVSRRWGVKTITRKVAQTGRTGWYVRVTRAGQISAGDSLQLIARPHPDWTVARLNDLMFGRQVDRAALMELQNLPELARSWKDDIA